MLLALLLAASLEAQRAHALLRYVADDYPTAVGPAGEVLTPQELQEQEIFTADAASDLRAAGAADLAGDAEALGGRIRSRSAPGVVVPLAADLAERVAQRFQLVVLPPRRPDLKKGTRLYRQACAACHGADGTPRVAALQLGTRPTAFSSPAEVAHLSPQRIFTAITFGVPGTAMPAFGDAIDEPSRWDVAYAALLFAHPPDERRRGEVFLKAFPRRPDWLQLAVRSDDRLRAVLGRSGLSPADREAVLSAIRGSFADPAQEHALR
jgi:high-affinity iron transporter